MTNLIISVNPVDPSNPQKGIINVKSVKDSNDSYNIANGDTFVFTIRGTLPNN